MPSLTDSVQFPDTLRKWIQPHHLTPEGLAAINRDFNGREERYAVVDAFLDPSKLDQIRQLIQGESRTQTFYKLFTQHGWVDREKFETAPDADRFIYEDMYLGPQPGQEMATPVLTDVMFRTQVHSRPFATWLEAATGLGIGAVQKINLKRLERKHFLRWHSDNSPNRALCLVLYLHHGWDPAFGGRLLMQRAEGDGFDAIDPLFNRLVLFGPNVKSLHAVEEMTDAAANWSRLNYSLWFTNP